MKPVKGERWFIDSPEAVIIGDDLNLYRMPISDLARHRDGDRVEIPKSARREGTLLRPEEQKAAGL